MENVGLKERNKNLKQAGIGLLAVGVGLTYIFLGLVLVASAFLFATVPVIIWGLAVGGICAALVGVGMLVIGVLKRPALSRTVGFIYMLIGAFLLGISATFTFPAAVLLFVLASIGFLVTAFVSLAVGEGFSKPTLRKPDNTLKNIEGNVRGNGSKTFEMPDVKYDIDELDSKVEKLTIDEFLRGVEATMKTTSQDNRDISGLSKNQKGFINKFENLSDKGAYKAGDYIFHKDEFNASVNSALSYHLQYGKRLYCIVLDNNREKVSLLKRHMESYKKQGGSDEYIICFGENKAFIFCEPDLMNAMLKAHENNLPSDLSGESKSKWKNPNPPLASLLEEGNEQDDFSPSAPPEEENEQDDFSPSAPPEEEIDKGDNSNNVYL